MTPRYFHGQPHEMGSVSALGHTTFEELCSDVTQPIPLTITRDEFSALPKKGQNEAKRVRYIVPSIFPQSPSPRTTDAATRCNLIAIDVDEADASKRILEHGKDVLGTLASAIWHTASSTSEAPRLRVLVSAEGIPISRYAAAVHTIADLLGINKVTRESLVPVQPMYLPVQFEDSASSPIVHLNPKGDPFTVMDINDDETAGDSTTSSPLTDDTDFAYLRAPMDGIEAEDIRDALTKLDPDCGMQEWIEAGMALKHQFGEDGFALWDEWSQRGKKYDGEEVTQTRWNHFKPHPANRAPVTIRSVIKRATDAGWKHEKIAAKTRTALKLWIEANSRTSEELLDEAPARIAATATVLGTLERKALISSLRSVLAKRDMKITTLDVQKQVRQIEIAEKQKQAAAGWARGLCYITSLNIFYRHATDRRFKPEVIDLMYSVPSTDEGTTPMSPKHYLIQVAGVPQVEAMRYEPKMGTKRYFTERDVPYVNVYRPSPIQEDPERAEEAGAMFLEHMTNLIAEDDYRAILIDWIAFQFQHPGEKVNWAVLLQGGNGCGKSFVGEVFRLLLGQQNVAKISGGLVMEDKYNGWAQGHQVVAIEEVRVVGQNRHAVMDKIKPLITDAAIVIREMREPARTVPNVTNYIMTTNHRDALAVNDDDRRYFVLCSRLQRPEQLRALGGEAYFEKLYGMLKDNAGGLLSWLRNWPISDAFKPEGRAPVTKYLRELAENASSPLAAAVRQAIIDQSSPLLRSDLLSLTALRGAINDRDGVGHFSDQALAAVLREMGWEKVDRCMIEGTRHTLFLHGTSPIKHDKVRLTAVQRMEVL